MGLSRKHLSENYVPVHFDLEQLAVALKEQIPEADFCLLMGSAVNGTVPLAISRRPIGAAGDECRSVVKKV